MRNFITRYRTFFRTTNALAYSLYGLTPDEIALVEGSA